MSIRSVVDDHKVVVCVGSGGVGKTTTAASIAVHGAMNGRRAMVLTIDPARRLAQSLGLEALGPGGQEIAADVIAASGVEVSGSLSAGMLDQKSAWDEFIARHAPSEETRDTILANEFYQHLSQSFAGSAEYMAVEELCRIFESGDYDLIVLDTPPSRHALDFLEAPGRLDAFLDSSVVGWFVKPYASAGWAAWKTASKTARFLFDKLEDATGMQSLRQISEFFVSMEGLFDGINERFRRVRDLLSGTDTAFVLVAGPDEQVLGESESLTDRMRSLGMPLKAVVMNRVHPRTDEMRSSFGPEAREALAAHAQEHGLDADVTEWLESTFERARLVSGAEALRREVFESGLEDDVARVAVAEFERDIHDLAGLAEVAQLVCK